MSQPCADAPEVRSRIDIDLQVNDAVDAMHDAQHLAHRLQGRRRHRALAADLTPAAVPLAVSNVVSRTAVRPQYFRVLVKAPAGWIEKYPPRSGSSRRAKIGR